MKAAGCSPGPASTDMREVVAAFWAGWAIYLMVKALRVKTVDRIGYVLSAILTAFTSYLLVAG